MTKPKISGIEGLAERLGDYDAGTLPASGTYTPVVMERSATANPSGTSDYRSEVLSVSLNGVYGATEIAAENLQLNVLHTSGDVSFAIGRQGYIAVGTPSTPTTTGTVHNAKWMDGHISHTGTGTVDFATVYNSSGADIDVGTGLINTFHHFHATDDTAVSGRITTENVSYYGNDLTNDAPIVATVLSEMAAGAHKWFLYGRGGAASFIAGKLRLGGGSPQAPSANLEVVGSMLACTVGGVTAALGFAAGAGGAVTQATTKTSDVTLNKPCGKITLNNSNLAANAVASFHLNCDQITSNDVVLVSIASGATVGAYVVTVDTVAGGQCTISLRNLSAGTLSENVVINYVVIKAVAA